MPDRDIAGLYLRWTLMRAACARGWWLVTSVYLVVVADLSPFQLVVYGGAMSVTALLAEIPTGVMADTISRKRSLIIAHAVTGAGMLVMGFVTAYPLVLVSQVLWGLGWTFFSGAEVAWVSDELDEPDRISRVLLAGARWDLAGSAIGLLAFGAIAWAADLDIAIMLAGAGMMALGLFVAARFPEDNFTPTREHRWRESASIFRRGVALARRDREILVVLAATVLVNGGALGAGFLQSKRLLELGFPEDPDPIVWFTVLGLAVLALGAVALRMVEARIDGVGVARWVYAGACVAGAFGIALLAFAPSEAVGVAGVMLMGGIAWPVTRAVGAAWVNRRTTSDVRATVHSFLGQAEYAGEITAAISLAIVAAAAGITVTLACAAAIVAGAAILVWGAGAGRRAE